MNELIRNLFDESKYLVVSEIYDENDKGSTKFIVLDKANEKVLLLADYHFEHQVVEMSIQAAGEIFPHLKDKFRY